MPIWPRLRSARKELAISATAASLGGNPRLTSLSICLITTSSLSLLRLIELGVQLAREGRPARR
jgi:hypothetical protein